MELLLTLSSLEGIPEVTVVGEIDIASAPRLDEMLTVARESNPQALLVSLQRFADYCDLTGLSVLIKHAREVVGKLCVIVPPEAHIRKIFRVAQLEEALGVVDSVAAAIRRLRSLAAA